MFILAKSLKGKEFMYSRRGVVEFPKSWSNETIEQVIKGLNKYFKLDDSATYSKHEIDDYDSVWPEYKVFKSNGAVKLKRI